MENFFISQFTWQRLLLVAISLLALFFLLKFLDRILGRFNFLGKYQEIVKNCIHYTLLIYEVLALLILGSVFVLINPQFHGILALIVVVGGFTHIKNYFSGRIVQYDNSINVGKRLKTENVQGIISDMGRLGIKVRTKKGLQFINYSNLVNHGYMLLSGDEVGGFYQLNIKPNEIDEKIDYHVQLIDLLATTPYLDWNHKPQIIPSKDDTKSIQARVVVKEESHLHDLITLINEWGYSCRVV